MCVVSMVVDHFYDKWKDRRPEPYNPYPSIPPWPGPASISPEEIQEFRELLKRAREYDKRNNEPDCEMDEKKQRLQKLADELGVTISFE